MAKFLDDTGLATFWAKIKSLVTGSIQALDVSSVGGAGKYISAISETDGKISATATTMDTTPTADSTKAVTSGGIKTALGNYVPFSYKILDTNPFGGKHLYLNYIGNAMFSMDKRYFVTATFHERVVDGVEYPRIKPGASVTDDVYYEDSPVVSTVISSTLRTLFNGYYDGGITIASGRYLKIHIQFSDEENWTPATGRASDYEFNYGDYFLSFYYSNVPSGAKWRCYNTYAQHTVGWKQGDFSYYAGNASSANSVILTARDAGNHKRTCIEFVVFPKDSVNANLTQIDWCLDRPTLSKTFPLFTNFADQSSYVDWYFKQKVNETATIEIKGSDGSIKAKSLTLTNTPLAVSSGGTGKTTAKAAEYNLTTGKSEISDTTSGDDRVVFELASPSESNGVTRGFRKLSTIWTWIKGLLSSESGVNISGSSASCTGNAATASAAQSGSALETAINGKMNTSASNATAPSSSGGDGATATLLNNLTDGNSDIVTTDDGDNVLIATTDNGGSVTNKWYKRKLVKLIPWIIKKLGTRLVYDCGAGSTSNDDFDAALAAFNAGQWVIIHNDNKVYYCVGTYNSGLRFKQLANDASLLKVNTLNWTRGSSPSAGTQIEASLSGHTHSQYLTASDITGKMATDCSNKASGALQNLTSQLTEGTSPFTDGTEIFSSYASDSGFASTDHVNQPYRRTASSMLKYIANSGLAQLVQVYGNSAKKIEIGYATIADTGNSSEMKALVELTCVSQTSTSQPGSSMLMLVSVSCSNTYRFARATILENTYWDGRTRPVIVTKVVSNKMYVYVGLLANNGTSLVSFDYTYAKITRIGYVNNWSWEPSYTTDGTFDHIFYCDDSVKFVPTVNSNTIGTTAGISSGSPADACVTYWSAMQPGCIRMVYNQNGTEYTILFSKSSDGKYGSILKWSYTDNYMRIIRIQNNSVLTGADWVKISAGYADSAGSLSSSVSVGSANQPVYFNNGSPTACNWWVS